MFTLNKNVTVLLSAFFLASLFLFLASCDQPEQKKSVVEFDYAGSDQKAIELADAVMAAMGGQEAWENTRFITWDLFGKRLNVWDKETGRIRVESKRSLILMNLNTMEGRAWKDGHEMTEAADVKRATEYGHEAWINDSYWMFAPYKLKDPGVTLKYLGEGTSDQERLADIISVTFDNVGLTPNNKYHMYIDKETGLVTQWEYYMDATDPVPRFKSQWNNYQRYGKIMLYDDPGPGARKKHKNIMVFEALPDSVFEKPSLIDWEAIKKSIEHFN